MKQIKFLGIVSLLSLSLGIFSFADRNTPKPLSAKTFYYVSGAFYQRIEPNVLIASPEERSINADAQYTTSSSQFMIEDNWSEYSTDAGSYALYNTTINDGSSYLLSFSINSWESDSDGYSDGAISLSEALSVLYDYYRNNLAMPTTTLNVGSIVTIYNVQRAENAH